MTRQWCLNPLRPPPPPVPLQVNALLQTTVSAFRQTTKGGKIVHRVHPDTPYTFPAHLDGKLLFLTNLADFPTVKRRNGRVQAIEIIDGKAAATDYAVLLETLEDFYKTTGVKGSKDGLQQQQAAQGSHRHGRRDDACGRRHRRRLGLRLREQRRGPRGANAQPGGHRGGRARQCLLWR